MENKKYLYFVISKERFEQVTIKRELFLNPDVYIVKVKKYHSYWHDLEFEFSTEIYAESQSYVLLRTTNKWHEHDIKSLTVHSRFCEIHYGSDDFNLTTYYTDKNLKDAFKDFEFKKIDDHEVKRYLYFVVRQSALDKLAYRTNENHYKLRVGSNGEFTIGCDVINRNNENNPYALLRSTSDLQNSIFLKDAIKSFENDSNVIGNKTICRIYYNKDVINESIDRLCHSGKIDYIRYFTDEELESMMVIYDFEEKDTEDSSIYSIDMKNGIDFNTIAEYVKNNNITKENKDMPPYKHHIINPGTLSLYLGDCSSLHSGVIQEAKHITVKDIKFNGPATIIFYADGSKEVVKRQKNDKIDKEKAIYMAMLKHKNKKLFSIINKALSSEDPEKALAYELIKYEGGDANLLHQLCDDAIKEEKPKKKIKKNNAKVATKKTNKKSKEDK